MERTTQSLVYLDTHIVCWLYEGLREKLSQAAIDAIEANNVFVSPMVDLELQYLYELGKITEGPEQILTGLTEDIALQVSNTSFQLIVTKSRDLNWTRDPFDRLIVAEVMSFQHARLITKDRLIHEHCDQVVW